MLTVLAVYSWKHLRNLKRVNSYVPILPQLTFVVKNGADVTPVVVSRGKR